MPVFQIHIHDGVEAETSIDCPNTHEAINSAFNALSRFACKRFPPPENISITVATADGIHVATLKMTFDIEYGPGVVI